MVGKLPVGVEVACARIAEHLQSDAPVPCRLAERGNVLGRREVIRFSGVQLHPETWTSGCGKVRSGVQEKHAGGGGALGPESGDHTRAHGHADEQGLLRHTPEGLPSAVYHRCPADPVDELESLVQSGRALPAEEVGRDDIVPGASQPLGREKLNRAQAENRVEQGDVNHSVIVP